MRSKKIVGILWRNFVNEIALRDFLFSIIEFEIVLIENSQLCDIKFAQHSLSRFRLAPIR